MVKGYKDKIQELQRQIEEKAKELGQISYMVEELTKQRVKIGESITKAEEELREKLGRIPVIEARIEEANKRAQVAESPFDIKVSSLERTVAYLGSLTVAKKADLENVNEIQAKIEKLKELQIWEKEKYLDLLDRSDSIEEAHHSILRTIKDTQEERDGILRDLSERQKSNSLYTENLHKYHEELRFYARRLYKLYASKGLAFPTDLLVGFAPLKFHPSRALKEKLELKRKVRRLS